MKAALGWLGEQVYGAILPVVHLEGARTYLPDLWREAPVRVALAHSLLALFLMGLPVLYLKPRLLFQLTQSEKEALLNRALRSRIYLLRTILLGVRGHALVAILRKAEARNECLTSPNNDAISTWKNPPIPQKQITS